MSGIVAGVFALAFVVGHGILNGWCPRRITRVRLVSVLLCIAIGMALLTPVLVLLAELSWFRPVAVGIVGFAALGTWAFLRRHGRWRCTFRRVDAALFAAAAAFVVVASAARDEPWGAGRDQQVYATFARALAVTGSAASQLVPLDEADAQLLRAVAKDREVDWYLGIRRSERDGALKTTSYLPLGWTVWLAVATAIGGDDALAAANALIFAAGALLVFAVLRRDVGRTLAVAATIALFALPSSLWITGVTLSEPLSMLLWLALAALLASRGWRALRWAPVLVFAMTSVRIDALAIGSSLSLAILIAALLDGRANRRRNARHVAVGMLAACVAAIAWYATFHREYLDFNFLAVAATCVATASVALMAFAPARILDRCRVVLQSQTTVIALPALIAALLAYAAIVRPHIGPFALIHNGSGLEGTRDFREESLRNLAQYIGWPLVVLGGVGAIATLAGVARERRSLAFLTCSIVGVAFAILYLAVPLVSPDHPWAVRRMIPVVIPAAVMFAAVALRRARTRAVDVPPLATAAALVLLACGATVAHGTRALFLHENAGMGEDLARIGKGMPNELVVCDIALANTCGPLGLAMQRPVVVGTLSDRLVHASVARWIDAKAKAGKPAWLLHVPSTPLTGALATRTARWRFVRHFVAPTTRPPARDVASESIEVDLSRIDGLDRGFAAKRFGATPVFGVADRGFYASEASSFGAVRMTNGSALLEVPVAALARFHTLVFDWFSWAPRGERRLTRVTINGREAWRQDLAPGPATVAVPLPALPPQGAVRIGIESDAFDPRVFDPSDRRTRVGIGLLGIRGTP